MCQPYGTEPSPPLVRGGPSFTIGPHLTLLSPFPRKEGGYPWGSTLAGDGQAEGAGDGAREAGGGDEHGVLARAAGDEHQEFFWSVGHGNGARPRVGEDLWALLANGAQVLGREAAERHASSRE